MLLVIEIHSKPFYINHLRFFIQIHDAMKEVPEVTETEVKLVWYPAWSVDKMSRYARIALGIR